MSILAKNFFPSAHELSNTLGGLEGAASGYRETVLENGLRVVTDCMPGVRSVSLGVLVDAGPNDEAAGKEGLAHLSEHLLFQGTASRDALEIAQMMDGAGGQVGGFTTKDYTCFFATVLDDYLTYALDLLGDVLLNSIFPEASVEREKNAILCEIEAAGDRPSLRVDQLMKQGAWPEHALGRPVAGHGPSVSALSREDIIYFVHRHYLPDRVVVAAAGRIEHDDFVAQVRDAFWRLGGSSRPRRAPAPAPRGGVITEERPVAQAYFSLGLPIGPYADGDRYALHCLNQVLGSGISSRLFRRLREESGLVYDLGSEIHAYRDQGLWVVEGSTRPELLEPVLSRVMEEVTELLDGGRPVDEEELVRTRRQLGALHWLGGEDTHTRMSRLAVQQLYFGRPLPTTEIVAEIEDLSSEDLRQAGRRVLRHRKGAPTLAILGPESVGGDARRIALEDLLQSFLPTARAEGGS